MLARTRHERERRAADARPAHLELAREHQPAAIRVREEQLIVLLRMDLVGGYIQLEAIERAPIAGHDPLGVGLPPQRQSGRDQRPVSHPSRRPGPRERHLRHRLGQLVQHAPSIAIRRMHDRDLRGTRPVVNRGGRCRIRPASAARCTTASTQHGRPQRREPCSDLARKRLPKHHGLRASLARRPLRS